MTRLFILGFGLILAQESCGVSSCEATGCVDQNHVLVSRRNNVSPELLTVAPGATLTVEKSCNTCAHNVLKAAWSFDAAAGGPVREGQVEVFMTPVCAAFPLQGFERRVPIEPNKVSYEVEMDHNVRNPCGNDVEVDWSIDITNKTNVPMLMDLATLSCPRKSGGSPTSP